MNLLFSFSGASCFSSPGRLLHPVRSVGNVCLRSSSSHFPLAANYNSSLTIRTVAVKRRRDKWCAEQCPHSRLVRQLSQMSYSLPSTLPNNEALKGRKEERKQPAKLSRRPAALKKKKSHTPPRNIKCSAHVALIHKQKGIFLSSRRMFFFPSRWCVIIYILPKMRICGCCCIYTNSDLQGGYRWQILRLCGRLDKSLEEWSQLI